MGEVKKGNLFSIYRQFLCDWPAEIVLSQHKYLHVINHLLSPT